MSERKQTSIAFDKALAPTPTESARPSSFFASLEVADDNLARFQQTERTVAIQSQSLDQYRADAVRDDAEKENLRWEVNHDHLTGLLNRAGFEDAVEKLKVQTESASVALVFIDLDNFKIINDTFSHDHGDHALKVASKVLANSVRQHDGRSPNNPRPSDIVARKSGDEFLICFPKERTNDELQADTLTVTLYKTFHAHLQTERAAMQERGEDIGFLDGLDFSLGVEICSIDEVGEKLALVDAKMYQNKRMRKNLADAALSGRIPSPYTEVAPPQV